MITSDLLNFIDSSKAARLSQVLVDRVESRSFSAVRLNSEPESLRQFDQVFKDESLRPLVRSIDFDVVLPTVSEKRLRKYQSTAEARANSVAFSEAILQLFERLSVWKFERSHGDVHLTLTATSPSDDPDTSPQATTALDDRNAFKYITVDKTVLGSHQSLPFVLCITSLDWNRFDERTKYSSGRLLHPEAVSAMISALPSLGKSIWHITMPPRRLTPLRREIRSALAEALNHPSFPALESLAIHLKDRQPLNERAEPESYVEQGEEDPLSTGVRNVCQLPNLARLELRGSWILSASAFAGARLGSSLEYLLVDLAATTPDGRWHLAEVDPEDQEPDASDTDSEYYDDYNLEREPRELPDIDSEDSDREDPELPEKAVDIANFDLPMIQIRGLPGPDTLVPLLSSFAEAVGRAGSAPGSSLRSAEVHLSAEMLMAQPNLGYIAAGQVEKDMFLNWPRPEQVGRTGQLEGPDWYWAASGPYGPWSIPTEVRAFMRGDIHDNS